MKSGGVVGIRGVGDLPVEKYEILLIVWNIRNEALIIYSKLRVTCENPPALWMCGNHTSYTFPYLCVGNIPKCWVDFHKSDSQGEFS